MPHLRRKYHAGAKISFHLLVTIRLKITLCLGKDCQNLWMAVTRAGYFYFRLALCYNNSMEFVELTESEVKGLDFACDNFLQSWEMYRRYQQIGRESYFIGVKDVKGKVVAAGLMVARPWHFGKKVFRVPGGWLMDYDQLEASRDKSDDPSVADINCTANAKNASEILQFLTTEARQFCRQKRGIALEIAPNIISQPRDAHNQVIPETEQLKSHLDVRKQLEQLGYKYLGEYEQVKWTFVLDLKGRTADELFKAFRTDHRQRIRRAEREGVRVRELNTDELNILKEIAAEAGERHGFKDPDLDYYRSMQAAFGEKVKFVVAELSAEIVAPAQDSVAEKKPGRSEEKKSVSSATSQQSKKFIPLAAAMFVNDSNELVYLYSGSVRELQKYGGAHLIQWQMIQEAIKAGCKKYNFYGVYPVEGNGVYNFKLGFRGRVEELLGTFILPIGLLGRLYAARLKPHEYGEVH